MYSTAMITIAESGIIYFLEKSCSEDNYSFIQCIYRTWKKIQLQKCSGKMVNGYRKKLEEE